MLRLLIMLLWLPISAHANVYKIDKQELRLELSEILSRMDSTESILFYTANYGMLINKHGGLEFSFDHSLLTEQLYLLNLEYLNFKCNPYGHDDKILVPILTNIYDLLVRPISCQLNSRILINTDASLSEVPWNILIDRRGAFLLDNYEITICPYSIKTLNCRKYDLVRRPSIFVSAPKFEGSLDIENAYERSVVSSKFTKKSENSKEADIIHISSHGSPDGIHFDSKHKLLRKSEIPALQLHAPLIFLNTCYSSDVARVFVSEGVGVVIGTQWQVADQLAIGVSDKFYDVIMQGKSASAAIRIATLEYKNKGDFDKDAHPFQWGGYYAFGSNDEIVKIGHYGIKKAISMMLSIFTTFSLIFYYFGNKAKGKLLEYNLI